MDKLEKDIIFILLYILLEKIIFNKYFYSHQMISINIICIILIYYHILNIIQSKFNLSYILFILSKYSYTFILVLIKYLNTNFFINIYLLGSIFGFFGLIHF